MRFAGPMLDLKPEEMPYLSQRYAGSVAKENPGLVERITAAIVPGQQPSEHERSAR